MARGRIEVDEVLCKGCGLCVMVCPRHVIALRMDCLTPKGYHPAALADPNGECTGCAICAVMCPDAAITVYRWVPATRVSATSA